MRWLVLTVALAGCLSDPRDDFEDFLGRADRTPADGGGALESRLEDLDGVWLFNSLLAGGLDLALRMRFEMVEAQSPITLRAQIWLSTQRLDERPIVETETTVGPDGRFILRAEPLMLGPNELPVNTTVSASVILDIRTLSHLALCGTATGSVSQPLMLDLSGTTFSALKDDAASLPVDEVPQRCPGQAAAPDAGAPGDAGRPAAPDLSAVPSRFADLSGTWYMNARLAGSLSLALAASLELVPSPSGGGAIDGALRRVMDPPGSPALVTFSTPVSPDGRFELWIPELALMSSTGDPIRARLLLVGATLGADAFCGAGAGAVFEPIDIDLAGTTFHAQRWTPGTPEPTAPAGACP